MCLSKSSCTELLSNLSRKNILDIPGLCLFQIDIVLRQNIMNVDLAGLSQYLVGIDHNQALLAKFR